RRRRRARRGAAGRAQMVPLGNGGAHGLRRDLRSATPLRNPDGRHRRRRDPLAVRNRATRVAARDRQILRDRRGRKTVKMPPFRDPRYVQALVLTAYAVAAREVFHFERSHLVTLGCVTWAVALDL